MAGCLGNSGGGGSGSGGSGGGGTTSVAVGIPSASTTTGAASNSFQRVVGNASPNTDPAGTIQWNNQETGGDPPSLRQFDQGNVQAMTGGNFIIASAKQDLEPFQQQPVDNIPHQAMSITALDMHILAVDGSGIRTTDDLVGSNFWPLPPQWGLRQQVEAVLGNAGLWSELQNTNSIVNADTGDVAGAISENRIDALVAYGAGGVNLAGMASLLTGVGYVDVLIAGIVPALVFYVSVAIGVHYMAVGQLPEGGVDLKGKIEDLDEGYHPLIEAVRFGLPFAVLLYTFGIAQWTILSSALYTCSVMVLTGAGVPVLLSVVRGERDVRDTIRSATTDTVSGFRFGAVTAAPIAIIIAAVNGIVDLLNATGMPGKLSLALVGIAGGVMLFTVILAMIICLVLGLGMPTVAAYTIVALLIAPTLIGEFGVPELAAHFFVFYAAILSGITPPIAIAVVVTAGIAGSNFWRTSLEALKLAMPLFVLPFTFVYNPEIVTGGFSLLTIQSGVVVLFGATAITHGLNCAPRPFNIPSPFSYGVRAVYVALGTFAMVWPTMIPRVGTVLIAVVLFAIQTWMLGRTDIGPVVDSE